MENQDDFSYVNSRLNLKEVSIFHKDIQAVLIFKKTERVVSAIYLLTNFLSDNEPIKRRMREVSNNLLSCGLKLSSQGHWSQSEAIRNFIIASFEIISLFDVADMSGILSSVNCKIMKSEIEKMIEQVEQKEKELNVNFLTSGKFFETEEGHPSSFDVAIQDDIFSRGNGNKKTNSLIANIEMRRGENTHKGQINVKDSGKNTKKEEVFNKGHIVKDKNYRYDTIISLLKKSKEISVKDVSIAITDCSEKTLQRELLSLVDKGVLKKEGERRWSKYSLTS